MNYAHLRIVCILPHYVDCLAEQHYTENLIVPFIKDFRNQTKNIKGLDAKAHALRKAQESSITKEEIERAIFIDFEGFEDKPPTLIGFWSDETFSQIIFDRALQPAAKVKGLSVQEPKQFMQHLLKRAIDENRRIIAYTQHEKNVAKFHFGVDLSPVYADARMIAVKWLNRIKRKHVN